MSFEIINDTRSEPLRDLVSKTVVEMLGPELPYGPWRVLLRSERDVLSVVMTGPEALRQEWVFDLNADGAADLALELRRRFSTPRARL